MLKNVILNLEERVKFDNSKNLPNSFRMLLVGSSGCGKTTLLFQMLLEPDFIDYNNLLIFTTTTNQQEYQLLYHGFSNGLTKEQIASIAINQKDFKGVPIPILCKTFHELTQQSNLNILPISVQLSDNINNIPPPDKLDINKKHLIIFDDCINNMNQSVMNSYYSRSRHNSCNCIYLSQSYFDLDRSIRLNANFVILFKLSKRNLNDVYNSVVGTIMPKDRFTLLAENTWSNKYQYIAVDRENDKIIIDVFTDSDGD